MNEPATHREESAASLVTRNARGVLPAIWFGCGVEYLRVWMDNPTSLKADQSERRENTVRRPKLPATYPV